MDAGGFSRLAVIALALVATLATPAPAAEREDGHLDYNEMSLEQLTAIPVYAASKRDQRVSEAPSVVTLVTSRDIETHGWRTLGDLLQGVPGFYVSYPRSYGFVGVRGIGRPGDFGGRILILVDGHRMNDPVYDTAAIMEDFILDLALVDRVEIVRGPGSALFGNNAFFAVVNVISKRADQIGGFDASGGAGTFDTYRSRLTYGTRSRNGIEVLASASGFKSHGNPRTYFPEFDSPATANGVVRNGDGESARRFQGTLRHAGLTLEGFYVGRDKHSPVPLYGEVFGVPRLTIDDRAFLEGRFEQPLSSSANLSGRLYYDWYTYRGDYPYDVAPSGQPMDVVINRDSTLTEAVGSEVQFNFQPSAEHTATLGAELRYDFRQMLRNFDVAPRAEYLSLDPHSKTLGLYVQDEYRPRPNLRYTAGLRYDRFDTFGDTWNPRLAAVYNPLGGTSVKVLYGRAFRAPNINEFYYSDGGITSKANHDIQPERITTFEVAYEQRLNTLWSTSVSGFLNTVSNLIDEAQDPVDSLYYSANLGNLSSRGVELVLEGQVMQHVVTTASYTFARATDRATGRTLNNSPAHLGKVRLTAPLRGSWLLMGAEAQYISRRTAIGGEVLNPRCLVNATLLGKGPRSPLGFSVTAYNVFDVRYGDPDAGFPNVVVQDGRTFQLTLTTGF